MKNTDKVSFVCFSTGGSRDGNKTIGTKVRFTNDRTRYTKALGKLGVSSVHWVDLPNAMTKADAIAYLRNDNTLTEQVYQDAINKAASRLFPTQRPTKQPKAKKNSK
jgi:hypothetical protein